LLSGARALADHGNGQGLNGLGVPLGSQKRDCQFDDLMLAAIASATSAAEQDSGCGAFKPAWVAPCRTAC